MKLDKFYCKESGEFGKTNFNIKFHFQDAPDDDGWSWHTKSLGRYFCEGDSMSDVADELERMAKMIREAE